ncbi:hypothetical protein VU06_04600 [Desulfobulbus sp. F3]|nr:hypothetical protein [Desulfobulbus sp. F3]
MAKHVADRPDGLKADGVKDIYSISKCISDNFADYIDYWRHNGYWLFDSPEIIQKISREHFVDITNAKIFYYEVYELEYDEDEKIWMPFFPELSFETNVRPPETKTLEGYDVVAFSFGSTPGCSPLSCNYLASEIETNEHCLLPSLERAKQLLDEGRFEKSEPGPYRIFAVYSV